MKTNLPTSSDVSTAPSLTTGLTAEQKEIIKATGPKLGTMSLAEFKHALVRPMVTAGIKTLPGDLETQLLYEQVQKYYKHITLGDFYLAFELNSLGQSWVRVDHFNLFNLAFISDVLNRYLESKGKAVIQMQKAKPEPAPYKELEDCERRKIMIRILESDKAKAVNISQGRNEFIGTLYSTTITRLFGLGVLVDDDWTAEVWRKYQLEAKRIAKNHAREHRYSKDYNRFFETYKIELSRLMYFNILENEQLFNTVIKRLNYE